MKKMTIVIFFFLSFFAFDAFAQTNKLSQILSKMEGADKGINTLEADFKQTLTFLETKEKQSSQGRIFFMKPKNILIEKKTPQEQDIYIKGDDMTIWTPRIMQAVKSVVPKESGDFSPYSFINFGGNWKNLQKTNTIKYISETNSEYVLEVFPKNKAWIMTVYVSKTSSNPNKIDIKSKNLLVNIVLSDYKINKSIDKKKFQFTPPKGSEIINLN